MKRGGPEEAEGVGQRVARLLDDVMPPGWGFVLTIASYGENGYATWVSNVEREGAIKMLREMIGKMERQEPNV